VSEPTYLIELRHDPHGGILSWDAIITRLSDNERVHTAWGTTREEATAKAQAWIRDESQPRREGSQVFAGEDGELLDDSAVRVLRQP